MPDKQYRLRVYNPGSVSVVDFDLYSDQGTHRISGAPIINRQYVDLLEGDVTSIAWRIQVDDTDGTFIDLWRDAATGRLEALYRLCQLDVSVDGAAYVTLGTGRLTDLDREQLASRWLLVIHDERIIERETELFKTVAGVLGSGTATNYTEPIVWPGGIRGSYGEFLFYQRVFVAGGFQVTNIVAFVLTGAGGTVAPRLDSRAAELLKSDLKDDLNLTATVTAGNFNTLRALIDGAEFEVFGFGEARGLAQYIPPVSRDQILNAIDEFVANEPIIVWVVWPAYTVLPSSVRFIMPTHEPTRDLPKLVGGSGYGMSVGDFLEDCFEQIQTENTTFRFETAALTAIKNDAWYPLQRWRVKAKEKASEALKRMAYRPNMLAPLLAPDGSVRVVSLRLPQATDPSTFYLFDSSNILKPGPSYRHTARQQVTSLRFTIPTETTPEFRIAPFITKTGAEDRIMQMLRDYSLDFIREESEPILRTHDKFTSFVRREAEIELPGLHYSNEQLLAAGFANKQNAAAWANVLGREYFNRFGDGAVEIELHAAHDTAVTGTEAGKWVRVDCASLPNPATGALGGVQIFQVMSREIHPERVVYSLLHGGPSSAPLSAPTISAAAGSNLYELDVTISGLAAGSGYVLVVKNQAASSWQAARIGTTNETVTIKPVASGTTFDCRAYATAPGRISSAWSTTSSAATTSMAAPSVLAGTAGYKSIAWTWTLGRTDVPVEFLLDESTCPGTRERVVVLPANTAQYTTKGLSPSTTYCAGVRHLDPYGGVSAEDTEQVATTASTVTSPTPLGAVLLQGSAC